jgi:protein-L-isoaspartate(D-aspartate) O-methyltransferase
MSTPASLDPSAIRRQRMVESQLRPSGVNDLALLSAFGETPREAFVEPAYASLAYFDHDVPALKGGGRALLAPTILARLIQAARPRPGERALDVAGGSGYSASILARLGAHVVALETAESAKGASDLLAGQADVEPIVGDLALGAPAKAPFDVIVVNGAFEILPAQLVNQLAEAGRLVGIDASFPAPKAVLIERAGGSTSRRALFDAYAPRLEAFRRPAQFAF